MVMRRDATAPATTMIKLRLLACVLAFASGTVPAGTLPAEPLLLLGGSAAYASQDDAAAHPWSATSLGLFEQSYIDVSPSFGIYTAATIGFVVRSQDNGNSLDVGQYQTLSLNVLLGVGYRMAFAKWTGVAAAGISLGSTALNASNSTLSSFNAGGAGAGIGASLVYALTYSWGIGANVNTAYYFAIPGNVVPTMAPSGISVFGGIGVVFFFRTGARLPPAVSRY